MASGMIKSLFPLAIFCLGCLSTNVVAQHYHGNYPDSPRLQNSTTVSPYLNLLNQGSNVDGTPRSYAVYQTMVRPQLEQRGDDAMARPEIPRPQHGLSRRPAQAKVPFQLGANRTGHGGAFMSFSHYYTYPQQR